MPVRRAPRGEGAAAPAVLHHLFLSQLYHFCNCVILIELEFCNFDFNDLTVISFCNFVILFVIL